MEKYTQPTAQPTRKAASATLGCAIMAIAGIFVRHYAPEFYDADAWLAIQPAVVLAFAWAFKDATE